MRACSVASIVSDSLWPYGLYPTRYLCPWDFAGKNTGVGCLLCQRIFPTQGLNLCLLQLLHCRRILFGWATSAVLCLVASVVSDCLRPMDCSPPGSSVHGDSPGKHTGVGCHALLQGIFPTQGSNPGLLHCRRIIYQMSHQESPRILEWVAYPFS